MAKKSVGVADVRALADLFGFLNDATRLNIVCLLDRKEENVGSLCKALKVKQSKMSHHLGLLKMGRLVVSRRNGKHVIYSLNKEFFGSLMAEFNRRISGKK